MSNNRHREYLIIAEIERSGFIAGRCPKYWCAVELANELLLYGEIFPWQEPEKIKIQLRSRNLKEYQIKGNQLFFNKSIYGSTDGKYSVAVLPMDKNDLSVESFVRERENYSVVFSDEVCWDKKRVEYFDNFPCSYHISN